MTALGDLVVTYAVQQLLELTRRPRRSDFVLVR